MRRGVTFVAAGITAFTLVVLVSIAYAYQVMAASRTAPVQAAASPVSELAAVAVEPRAEQVSAREAASLAATLLERNDAYSVELATWKGVQAYKVTFSSGDVAYMSMDGQLLEMVPFTQTIILTGGGGGGGGRDELSGGGGAGRGGDHEDDGEDEHQEDHEDKPSGESHESDD